MSSIAWDCDGVLFDSEAVIRECYELAGAPMPGWAFGLPAADWTTPEKQARKNELYVDAIRDGHVRPTTAYAVACRVPSVVLTSASYTACDALRAKYPGVERWVCGLALGDKADLLRALDVVGYVDDLEVGAHIAEDAGLPFLRYRKDMTEDDVTKEISRWMQ